MHKLNYNLPFVLCNLTFYVKRMCINIECVAHVYVHYVKRFKHNESNDIIVDCI